MCNRWQVRYLVCTSIVLLVKHGNDIHLVKMQTLKVTINPMHVWRHLILLLSLVSTIYRISAGKRNTFFSSIPYSVLRTPPKLLKQMISLWTNTLVSYACEPIKIDVKTDLFFNLNHIPFRKMY
jgi:hypothetical protein